jgi:2-polyprenyl-3-methyl-5-hydroxy-6-metoxy-1,4-benzoquinol methylase
MEKNLFEVGADIDVEALMSRLSKGAKQRAAVAAPPNDPKPPELLDESSQLQQLTHEIQHSAQFTEAINHIPLKHGGIAGVIEFRIKKFLKWLVHWNTKGQADFNRSMTRSLALIAQDHADQRTKSREEADLIATRISDLEQQTSWKLRQLETQTAQSNQRVSSDSKKFSEILDELSRKIQLIATHSSESEREINQALKDIRNVVHRDVSTVVVRLEQELDRDTLETAELAKQVLEFKTLMLELETKLDHEISGLETKLDQNVSGLETKLNSDFSGLETKLNSDFSGLETKLNNDFSGLGTKLNNDFSGLGGKLNHDFDELRMRVLRAERMGRSARIEMDARERREHPEGQVHALDSKSNGQKKPQARKELPGEEEHTTFDYFLFEHRLRGPVSEIKRRHSIYLENFLGRQNVIDLGCGRGEFVELLTENGIKVTGIDSSEDMIDFCRDRGLPVVQTDIFDYLAGLPAGKIDGIFLSQVVEHFSPEDILKLLGMCVEKLEPGGVIVIETMNTNCPTALSNFYLDPTHVRPVPAEMLRFMLEQEAVRVKYLRFTSPLPGIELGEVLDLDSGLSPEVTVYQDYAVVAVKR